MSLRMIRLRPLATALGAAILLTTASAALADDEPRRPPYGYGMMGPGYGGGPGMMGPGYGGGQGYGMGPGMMGPGYGGPGAPDADDPRPYGPRGGYGTGPGMMGPGMMGPGYGMGYGMSPGMMGPGYGYGGHMGWGHPMMGRGSHMMPGDHMGYGMGAGDCPARGQAGTGEPLDVDDVKAMMQRRLDLMGNPRLELGKVEAQGETEVTAEIVTAEGGALVDRLIVDRYTGRTVRAR